MASFDEVDLDEDRLDGSMEVGLCASFAVLVTLMKIEIDDCYYPKL
jgi:hypothetical protein